MPKHAAFSTVFLDMFFDSQNMTLNGTDIATATGATGWYFALHSTPPTDGVQGTGEIAYTSYARVLVSRTTGFTAASGDPASVSPANNIDFPACTGSTATANFFSIGQHVSNANGSVYYWGPIGSRQGAFTATTADVFTIPGHSFSVDDRITFYRSNPAGLPTGVTTGVVYWVKTVSGDTVTISSSQGGSTLDVTASGDGVAFKVTPLSISTGITPRLTTSTIIYED